MQSLMRRLLPLVLLLAAAGWQPAVATEAASAAAAAAPQRADFERERPSPDARHVADWIVHSGDNGGMPYIIVDKVNARLFVFGAGGKLRGATSALVGLARGDESVPGIGTRELATIRPEERTTPAGRYIASLDKALNGDEILWVDYDSGVALHRVIATVAKERRLERLESSRPLDLRITYGCINVPVSFYDRVVSPTFTGTNGVVYVLPEVLAVRQVFGSYDVADAPSDAPAHSPAGRQGAMAPGSSR